MDVHVAILVALLLVPTLMAYDKTTWNDSAAQLKQKLVHPEPTAPALLSEGRIRTFIYMAEEKGSMQAFDAIEYPEFAALMSESGRQTVQNVLHTKLTEENGMRKSGEMENGIGIEDNYLEMKTVKVINKFREANERLDMKICRYIRHSGFTFLVIYLPFRNTNGCSIYLWTANT
jgi:hypothetical protein